MRIAILTSARTGSTSLYRLIERHLQRLHYTCVSEPFNQEWRDIDGLKTYDIDFFEDLDNVFVKTFVSKNQTPKSFKNDIEAYWKWFFSYFDKIILLDRLDKTLQSESLAYHMSKNNSKSWQNKQYYDLSILSEDQLKNTHNHLINESKIIHSYVNDGYPIFYFEDLYIDKNKDKMIELFNYINLDLNDKFYEQIVVSELYKIRLNRGESKFRGLI